MKYLLRFFILVFTLPGATAAWSEAPLVPEIDTVIIEKINVERAAVVSSQSLNDQQRLEIQAKLDEASSLLQQTEQLKAEMGQLIVEIKRAPEQIKTIQKERVKIEKIVASKVAGYSTEKLKSMLEGLRAQLKSSRSSQDEQVKLLASYTLLVSNSGSDIADINGRLDKLRLSKNSVGSDKSTADRLLDAARLAMLSARLALIKTRQSNLYVLTELATVRRDHYSAQISLLQNNIDQLHVVLQAKAGQELESAQIYLKGALAEAPTELSSLQNTINNLLKEQGALQAESSTESHRLDTVKRLFDELQSDQVRMEQVIEMAGDHAQVSTLLQKRRALIPSVSPLTEEMISYQLKMSTAILRQLALDEMLRETSPENAYIDKLLSASVNKNTVEDYASLRKLAEQSRDSYRNTIRDLNNNYNAYIAQLSSLDAITRQLLKVVHDYRVFINDHLIWMPSSKTIMMLQPVDLMHGIFWLVRPDNIVQLFYDAQQSILAHKLPVIVLITMVISLIFFRRRALSTLENSVIQARKIRTDSFATTFIALLSTLVLTLPIPVLLSGCGMILATSSRDSEYTLGIAAGLQGSGITLFLLLFIGSICRKNGLARVYLGWQGVLCDGLRKQISWITPLVIPLSFLFSISTTGVSSVFVYISSRIRISEPGVFEIGQISFIAMMILTVFSVNKIWRKSEPLMKKLASNAATAYWEQYHALWFIPLMIIPVAFVVVSMFGYYYTATFLIAKITQTLLTIFVLVLVKDTLIRGLNVTQRRLRFEEALRIREELKKQREVSSAAITTSGSEADNLVIDEEKIPYGALSDQVNQLLHTGFFIGLVVILWWLWKDIIPVLNIFNTIELPISTTFVVDGVSKEVALTLSDLLAGLILGGLTLLATRSVPGLLEFTVLQRLPISRASSYAVTALTQYFVAMLGITISFNALGLQWSNIQWLVAALSVGLGFGLQEIVANFVSGIILLFEQPIRVGDVVSVQGLSGNSSEGVSGTVSRIRIRATTIINWDRQELIVPNKAFITGQLINWTLSDNLNRIIITVGVAYGSDTRKAMQLMREAADEHPKVMKEPEVRISFEAFGENSLKLSLRAFLNEIDARLPTITELHQAINDKFNAAGIVIAFPQRDLHFDTDKPLELILRDKTRKLKPEK